SHESFVALPTYFILPGMCMESPIVAQSMPPGKHADFTNSHESFVALPTYFILPGMRMESPIVAQSMPPGKHADFTNSHESFVALPTYFILPGMCMESPIVAQPMPPRKHADFTNSHDSFVALPTYFILPGMCMESPIVAQSMPPGKDADFTNQHIFVLGQGGFGGQRNSQHSVNVEPAPKRAPDAVVVRGFEPPPHRPHCGECERPPQAHSTRTGFPRVLCQTRLGQVRAYIDFKNVVTGSSAPAAAPAPSGGGALKSDALFTKITTEVKNNPDKAKSVGGVIFSETISSYMLSARCNLPLVIIALDLKTPEVYNASPKSGKADTTMTVSDTDLLEIASGSLNPQVAYLKGKLKIAGNIMLAQKLGPLLKSESKL
ncbi:Estradiol 17-beta-dehydrogenase, partial [Operophtera brumata]